MGALRLRALHDGPKPVCIEAQHVLSGLDHNPNLVLILAARDPWSVF